ncbi:hypothetical protein CSAL01_02295 [Colletotrichum salicis]|uniref:Uncharacterized protein n=1 Tax=Colletotrichum salicis TaxID=1209931 RepID=A0A135V2N3_9PEZI|nr:hypothetical protein CSAL01_02295 [Colletotrichum salicis]
MAPTNAPLGIKGYSFQNPAQAPSSSSSSSINPPTSATRGLPWVVRYLGACQYIYLTGYGSTLAFRTIQGPREHGWTFLTFRVRPCPPASTAPGYLKHPNANRSGAIHLSGTVTTPSNSNHC